MDAYPVATPFLPELQPGSGGRRWGSSGVLELVSGQGLSQDQLAKDVTRSASMVSTFSHKFTMCHMAKYWPGDRGTDVLRARLRPGSRRRSRVPLAQAALWTAQ